MKKQLSSAENTKLVAIKSEIDRIAPYYRGDWRKPFTPVVALAHAYGLSARKVRDCVVTNFRNNCITKRKVRSDAGATIFNSEAKRNSHYTAYNHFKKAKRKQQPEETFTNKELQEAWGKLDNSVRRECKLGAEAEKQLGVNLVGEVKRALQKTNGSISWERLAAYVAGGEDKVQPASKWALSKFVKATKDFRYFETRTLPQCTTEHTKKWRREWSTSFHIFWEGAKMIALKVQIIYFHIDEKWFYSLVIQKNKKAEPKEYGTESIIKMHSTKYWQSVQWHSFLTTTIQGGAGMQKK